MSNQGKMEAGLILSLEVIQGRECVGNIQFVLSKAVFSSRAKDLTVYIKKKKKDCIILSCLKPEAVS
jgi:hypothetical protein